MKKIFLLFATVFSLLLPIGPAGALTHIFHFPLVFRDYCPKDLVFLAFGDSITEGWQLEKPSDFPYSGYPFALLNQIKGTFPLRRNFDFINQGVGGEDTYEGLARFENVIIFPYPKTPDLILIMEGTNDHLSGHFLVIDANLRAMVDIALRHGKKVIIATNPPVWNWPGDGVDRTLQRENIESFVPWIYKIASDYGIPLADVFNHFVGTRDWEQALMSTGNHPNNLGYALIAQVFYDQIMLHMSASGCYY
jgi:lysophospholipase L1-like esterase